MAVRTFMDGSYDAKGIMPYMNEREIFDPTDLSTLAAFSPNSSILFKWLEDGSRPTYTLNNPVPIRNNYPFAYSKVFNISACGKYGTDQRNSGGHWPWVHIVPAAPDSLPLNTIQNEWLFQNFGGVYTNVTNTIDLTALAQTLPRTQVSTLNLPFYKNGDWEWVKGTGDAFYEFHSYAYVTSTQKWWVYTRINGVESNLGYRELWIPVAIKNNTNVQVTYTERWGWGKGSNGLSLDVGDTTVATIYTASVPMSDIQHPSHATTEVFVENDVYSICFDGNSRHSYEEGGALAARRYDAALLILPPASPIYSQYFDRTELNSRVAGEKGLYEDEFLTAGQVEAGNGVVLRWRTTGGFADGYGTVPEAGGNLIIESLGGGATRHQGANANTSVYYDEVTNIIRFQNFPRLHEEPIDGLIPIEFQVYKAPGDVGVIRAYGVNNNLYVSRGEGPAEFTIHTYPMVDAGFIEDQTVNHLRFRDTSTIQWDLLGTTMPTQTENGIIYRKGVVVRANAVAAFTGWYLQELNSIPQTQPQLISNNEIVQVQGINGVVCTLSLPNATTTRLQIDRPLRVYTNMNPAPVGGSNTTELVFKHYRGAQWRYSGYLGDYYSNSYDPGKAVQDDCIELDTIPFYVKDIEPLGKVGRREVYGLSRRTKSTMAQTQWAIDYDALGGQGRTLGYYQGQLIPELRLGGLGLYQAPVGVQDPVLLPGCRVDYHIVDGDRSQRFTRPYGVIDRYFNLKYWPTTIFQNAYYGNIIPRFPGLYRVTYRVQGLMGLPTGVTLNPVIHPRIHSFIMNDGNDDNFLQDIVDPFPKHFNNGVNVVGGMWSLSDFIPQVGTPAQASAAYLPVINSRPWEVYGEGLLVFDGHTQGCEILLRYNPGAGEDRFSFQVCYMYMSIEQVSDSADMKFGGWSMPYKDTKIHAELNALSSNYNYINF